MTGKPDTGVPATRVWDAAALGRAVRARRRAQKLTQEDLALLVGEHRPRIIELEAGKQTERVELIFKVLDAVGLDLLVVPRDADRGQSV
jgi:transcriptional regulator with XRE-family HTH domain